MGSWALKPFCVLHFLYIRNRLQPPWSSLSWKAQVKTVPNQGREGIQRQREQSKNNITALGQGPDSPSRDTHTNILELFCKTKIPPKRCYYFKALFIPERRSLLGQKISGLKECSLFRHSDPHQQPHPWTRRLHTGFTVPSLQVWTHSLEGISPLWPSLPGKQ